MERYRIKLEDRGGYLSVTSYISEKISELFNIQIGEGSIVHKSAILSSGVKIGENVFIGPFSIVRGSFIGDGTIIEKGTVIDSTIGVNCELGAEIKRSNIGNLVKAKHSSTILDGDVGDNVNIGAGVVFANYNGKEKRHINIGMDSFIGSNVVLNAPLSIGKRCIIHPGIVVKRDIDDDSFVKGAIDSSGRFILDITKNL